MLFTDETKNECSNGKQKVTIKINQNTIFLFITQFSLISRESTHSTHTTYASGFVCSCVWKIGKKRTQISLNLVKSRLAEEMKIVSGIERALQKQLHMDSKIVYVIFTIFDFFSHFKMNDKKTYTHHAPFRRTHRVCVKEEVFSSFASTCQLNVAHIYSILVIFSTAGVCPVLCSGHGHYGGGLCHCEEGYKGAECEIPAGECQVPGCSGHGRCIEGECHCERGFKGHDCSERKFFPSTRRTSPP